MLNLRIVLLSSDYFLFINIFVNLSEVVSYFNGYFVCTAGPLLERFIALSSS